MLSAFRPKQGSNFFFFPSQRLKLKLSSFSYTTTKFENPNLTSVTTKEETLLHLFKKCSTLKDFNQIHAQVIQSGFGQSLYLIGKIIIFCAGSGYGNMDYAVSIFETIENPDGFLWNTMIRGFGKTGYPEKALRYYIRMQETGEVADNFTFSFLLKVCGQLGSVLLGKQMHCNTLKHGFEEHVFVRNTLIHMYGLLGDVKTAHKLFEEMPNPNLVAWNAVIDCHVHCGKFEEALDLFLRMLRSSVMPDEATFVVTLSACSALGALDFGRWIQYYINRTNLCDIVSINNALIDMYAKCGAVEEAYVIFNRMKVKNLVTLNTMILGLATHGSSSEALGLFSKMLEENFAIPDDVTFLGVLCACSHGGMVDEGRRFFDIMSKKYCIKPTIKHYGCMADMLGRAGLVEEAYQLIMSMPIKCNSIVWRTLLAACRQHGNVELGEKVRRHLLELEPEHSSDFVLLANIYASMGEWNEMARIRKSMQEMGIHKPEPGNSIGIYPAAR
ncbi:hypothetical protein SLE2022_290830 [Rubroshorea leprosula]